MALYSHNKKPDLYSIDQLKAILSDIALGLSFNGKALSQCLTMDGLTLEDKAILKAYLSGNEYRFSMAHIKLQTIANKL